MSAHFLSGVMNHFMRFAASRFAVAILAIMSVVISQPGHGYPRVLFESEPNDTPEQAQTFRGEARVVGSASGADVDMFWWAIDDTESDRLWTLELIGPSEGAIRADLSWPAEETTGVMEFGAEPAETSETQLLALSTTPRQTTVQRQQLIVPPGEHLISILADDHGGDYQLLLRADGSFRLTATIDSDTQSEHHVGTSRDSNLQVNVPEYDIGLIADSTEGQLYALRVTGQLGATLEALIESADGEALHAAPAASPLDQSWYGLDLPADARLRIRRPDGESIGRVSIQLSETGNRPAVAAEPIESGTQMENADWLEPGEPFNVQLSPGQSHFFALVIPDDDTQAWDISVQSDQDDPISVCLVRMGLRANLDRVCRRGEADPLFAAIRPEPRDYALQVTRGTGRGVDGEASLEVTWRAVAPPDPAWTREPNDGRSWEDSLQPGQERSGHLESARSAWFELMIDREAEYWQITADGEGVTRLRVLAPNVNAPLADVQSSRAGTEGFLRADYLGLKPGRYLVELIGNQTDYRLVAEPMVDIDADIDADIDIALEPNNNVAQANVVQLGRTMRGRFNDTNDRDWFYFHLPGWNRVDIHLQPPDGGLFHASLQWDGDEIRRLNSVDAPICASQWLPPGDYYLSLWTRQAFNQPYHLMVQTVDPWSSCEEGGPASTREDALLLPADGRLTWGMGPDSVSEGYFRLPLASEAREVRIERWSGWADVELLDGDGKMLELRDTDDADVLLATVPGLEPIWLRYELRHSRRDIVIEDPAAAAGERSEVELTLESATEALAAHRPMAQRFSTRLSLTGTELAGRELELQADASHEGWQVTGLPDSVTLEPGETRSIDLEWQVPPELSDSLPVSLHLRAGLEVVSLGLPVDLSATPVNPMDVEEVPEHLLGLTNLAWNALGAAFVDPDSGENLDAFPDRSGFYAEFLIDGMSTAGSNFQWNREMGEPLPLLRLAGDGGLVHALAFNHRSSLSATQRWREVEILMGESPDALAVHGVATLRAGDGLQFMELDTPVSARYVQLRPLQRWSEQTSGSSGTGLLQVLGEPRGELAVRHHDLLETSLGGYWLYSSDGESALHEFPPGRPTRLPARGRSMHVVWAFLNQRAARLDRVEWADQSGLPNPALEQVRVYTSTESPVGPWSLQGDWSLELGEAGGATVAFSFDDDVWARYVKLQFDEPERSPGHDAYWRFPESIHVYERAVLGDRDSILGVWSMDGQEGPFEQTQPARDMTESVADTDSSDRTPRRLVDHITGRVHEPLDARHYALQLEAPDNTFSFELEESMSGRLQVELEDPNGQPVSLAWNDRNGLRQASAIGLEPGEYRLRVIEPPRSITFIWDASGSLAAHQPAIHQAINHFAQGIRPEQEVANLMVLGGPLLLREWATRPEEIRLALANYEGRFDSSDSEPALQLASRAMEPREGERVVFLITDAQVNRRDISAWTELERVRPRIFALEISHGDRAPTHEHRWYLHLMKGWANIGGGQHTYATGRTDLIRNFEAAMRQVREPTRFALAVERSYQDPPAPGTLSVVSGARPVVAGGVVHLIFDASGSMLRRMEGGRRIDVARRIVREMVDERIPDDVSIALRAFGHTEPHSCETELLVAPESGNHDAVGRAVDGIRAINLARTPLAASLDAVLEDLRDYQDQRRLVVMLTDGEETCDGDVEASVQRLIDQGVDVRLNIVGFHIDEIGLQGEFERFAALGGGEYFDSHDGDELADGLIAALAADFQVLDVGGNVVASGRVDGDAVTLDPGRYELLIQSDRGTESRKITIEPQGRVEVRVSE